MLEPFLFSNFNNILQSFLGAVHLHGNELNTFKLNLNDNDHNCDSSNESQ